MARTPAQIFANAATVITSGGGEKPQIVMTFPDIDAAHEASALIVDLMKTTTSTPGRAAEPDAMGKVGPRSGRVASELEQALAREAAADARADAAAAENDSLRTRAETAEAQVATRGWQDISTAPKDGTVIWVYAPAYEGLDAMISLCSWHEDAGFCIDELRSPTHWQTLNAPTAPATEADR